MHQKTNVTPWWCNYLSQLTTTDHAVVVSRMRKLRLLCFAIRKQS